MFYLLIDTTTKTVKIGLAENGVVFASDSWFALQELAENLTEKIEALLKNNGKTLQQLEKILVHSGPGGFSSLRIGVTEANVLAFGLGVPVWGIEGEFSELVDMLGKSRSNEGSTVLPKYSHPPLIGVRK
ncbi:MAG: tRNA (adenosine(37)-N6)-threonylcarbamoyltransferase complex dimerization subunit type 1 TsaB [bacterium]|nr:tRNA (adenosine(37)-N6)-threonylcarbamoyltransferase complex dimerization subunit type 1 TsaB [bacterium]